MTTDVELANRFVVLCEAEGGTKVALVVDDIIGQQQVVIKIARRELRVDRGHRRRHHPGRRQCRTDRRRAGPQGAGSSVAQECRLGSRRKGRQKWTISRYKDDLSGGSAANAQNSLQLIAFSIGEQTYGVEITTVREIRAWNGATPLPNTREYVRGVINLRGTIVPIFDLRARFGEGLTSPTKNHVVVVMSVGDKWVGILVDAVSDILTVSARTRSTTCPRATRSTPSCSTAS